MTDAPYRKIVSYNRLDTDYALYLDGALIGYAATTMAGHSRLNALVYDLLTKGPAAQQATIRQLAADAQQEITRRHHRQAASILRLAGTAKRLPVAFPRPARPGHRYGAALWARLADGPAADLALRQARQQPQATWDDLPDAWQPYLTHLGATERPTGISPTFGGGAIYGWGLEPTIQRFLDTLTDHLVIGIVATSRPDGSTVQHLAADQAERAWVAAVLATYPTIPDSLTMVPWWAHAPLQIATSLARLLGPAWQVATDGVTVSRTIPAPDPQGWISGVPVTSARRAA